MAELTQGGKTKHLMLKTMVTNLHSCSNHRTLALCRRSDETSNELLSLWTFLNIRT